MRITRDMLNNYRRLKREIPILEAELVEMKRGITDLIIARFLIIEMDTHGLRV